MIYLIDDKKLRQEKDFGWLSDEFEKIKKLIIPIYTLEEIEKSSEEIFRKENTVLYHESFLDNSTLNKQSVFKRVKLEQFAQNNPSFQLVIFSGSKNSRSVDGNIAHLPVSIVYQNLNIFAQRNTNNTNSLKYLAFGDNPEIERELLEKLEIANVNLEIEPTGTENLNCLFIPTYDKYIHNPINGATISEFYDQENDYDITEYIFKNLSQSKFENIFIPLCYGNTLSDYNGLRLATHIRCTESFNQLSRIYIYGYVGVDYLFQNEYFNILKTKNVFLVPYSKQAFVTYASIPPIKFPIEELPEQIAKLKLDVPLNYEDNHSIANEWAIYRWSESINADDEHIDKIVQKINARIYFKYLKTLYPISKNHILSKKDLKIEYSGNPKILYIDDEADKGWFEIFCNILTDKNGLTFEYLDDELDSKTQDEIINSAIDKIIKSNIDLVILDFRLHPNDFATSKIHEITGFILLKRIKKLNPGIQVIIFSATNKIWNLQALLDEKADGFIVKESPENSQDINFTTHSIISFKNTIEKCLKKCFIKKIFELIGPIANLVKNESEKKPSKFSLSISQQIIQNVNQRIDIFYKLLYNYPFNLEWPFSTLILIIEEIVNTLYIDEGLNHIVEIDAFNKVRCNYISDSKRVLCLKPSNNNSILLNEKYVIPENEMNYYNKASNRDPFNFRLACILHYRFLFPLGNEIYKYFPLYKLRSNSVMHIGQEKVRVKDLELGIDLLNQIIK